jgi:excisionase family DNA binding protein
MGLFLALKSFPVGTLTIEEAAGRLGLHYMTVYRYVRIGRLPAEYRGGRWHIAEADLELVNQPRTRGRRPKGARPEVPDSAVVQRLMDRLLVGDGLGAWQIVESALLAATPAELYTRIIGPCLRTIGDRWEAGEITVADEHRATAQALRIMGRLGPLFARPGRNRPGLVLLAGAEGDSHAIPLMMVADLLRTARFDVIQLGADVPVETLVAMASAEGIVAIGLSASTDQGAVNVARAVTALRTVVPGVPVLVGGPALPSEQAALELGADGWAADATGAVDLLTRMAGTA